MLCAGVVKLVDTPDLKSDAGKPVYGFDPRSPHHLKNLILIYFNYIF